jgi:hypothetical protein
LFLEQCSFALTCPGRRRTELTETKRFWTQAEKAEKMEFSNTPNVLMDAGLSLWKGSQGNGSTKTNKVLT